MEWNLGPNQCTMVNQVLMPPPPKPPKKRSPYVDTTFGGFEKYFLYMGPLTR